MLRKSQRKKHSGDSLKYHIREMAVASGGSKCSKKRSRKVQALHLSVCLLISAHKLKEVNLVHVALESEKPAFESEKHAKELEEHSEDKGERRKEREYAQSLELKKPEMTVYALRNPILVFG